MPDVLTTYRRVERNQFLIKFFRLGRLYALCVCLALFSTIFLSAAPQAQQQPAPPPPPPQQQSQPQQPANQNQNPFENVPTAPNPQLPPKIETKPGQPSDVIEAIEFRGSRRVPQDTLRALIYSKKGDLLNEDVIHRDFMALWNTGRFDDITVERERGKTGWILRFVMVERPVIRSITYEGNKSITLSEILDRYKERKVGLSVESQYDPNKIQRAVNVLKEYEAERGRQYATVTPEIRQVPPSTINIVFKINEGAKVKVANIDIEGNQVFSDREVIRAMKNLKPIGIPYSILFEDLFARTYDSTKLDEDSERVRQFYMEHGYFTARVEDRKVEIHDVGGHGFHIPLFYPNKVGKGAFVTMDVYEGHLYHLNNITFTGVKLFRTPDTLMRPLFQMSKGDVFSTAKLRKGIENMQKLYGEFGYIDFVAEPDPQVVPNTDLIDLNFDVDEGKQFFVRRIDFSGNTTTRDRVIRRELLIDEGDLFNSRLWEISLLRLNQLGYFEPLKKEDAADIKRDTKTDTVDITLKVKERGKNSIQLNGGVSGIAGSFIGLSYATNNFLGLGETLSLSTQLGTTLRSVQLGFSEPYLFGSKIQAGFTVYLQRYNFDQARQESVLAGYNLIDYLNSLGSQNLLNYVSNGYGFTTYASYQLKRSFARVGISYGYDISKIKTLTDAASAYFDYLDFQGIGGPSAFGGPNQNNLQGIRTSKVTPSYTYNTINNPINPTNGKSIFFSTGFAGSVIGGNVNTIEPTLELKYFRHGFFKNNVIGMHVLGRFITGYGGKVAPPFNRYYMGGENDIRGFDIWSISPIAYIPTEASINVLNPDGSQRMQKYVDPTGAVSSYAVTQTIPAYRIVFPGGDTNIITNLEYRIPIVGPVTLALFLDAGVDKLSLANQLKLNQGRVDQLNGEFPQSGFTDKAIIAPGTQKLRASTGIEIQVLMPVVNAPFRLYWAYNPSTVQENLQPPFPVDRSFFPNDATYKQAFQLYGEPIPFNERRSTFRFSVGRTF